MRRLSLLLALAATLIIAGLTFVVVRQPRFQKWLTPPVADLPTETDIAEMRDSLLDSQVGFQRIPEFTVPPKHVGVILGWLEPATYTRHPATFPHDKLGEIHIVDKAGRETRVAFFWTGHNPPAFTLNGTDFFYGPNRDEGEFGVDGGIRLGKAISDAYKDRGS
jgi:hypothetical protein